MFEPKGDANRQTLTIAIGVAMVIMRVTGIRVVGVAVRALNSARSPDRNPAHERRPEV